jgi:hypothetical protein
MAVNIVLRTDFDSRGLKEAERGLDKFKGIADKAFRGVAIGTGIAAAAFGKLAMDSIRAASNLEESTNAVNVAFGKSADAVLAIGANSAESLGLARNEFNEAAVRFSAFAERIVGDGGDASEFIEEVTQRASDFASVFNIEVAEALRVFQSGLAGEAEPLKRFGINLLQSEVQAFALRDGIVAVGEQMTETQKVQARYGLLLESTAKTAGDFANTSDGLANSQRILKARFTDLQAEIGQALLPAFTDLFKAVADRVMPEMEKLGAFLRSPDGQRAIEDLADTVGNLAVKFIENLEQIVRTAIAFGTFTVAVKGITTAVQLATTAQLLFNTAIRANPYVLAATGLLAFVAAVTAFRNDSEAATQAARSQASQIGILQSEIDQLKIAYDQGTISQEAYEAQLKAIQREQEYVQIATKGTAGELNRFNQLSLAGVRKEMSATAEEGARLANNQRQLYFAMRGETAPEFGEAFKVPEIVVPKGPSAFEQARDRVQQLIKSSQKQLRDAEKSLIESQVTARENYANNILRIEKDFADRLTGIVQQSQDRLRSAYRSSVETNIAALFDQNADGSVEGLVKSLSDKLAGSRRLLENSAQLASDGFSQTFIEQIVGAGTETGNELASAILQSTPETRNELKSLFSAIEREASTGMDSLSQQIFNDQGLATDELKRLYENTQVELTDAMLEQQTILDDALVTANDRFLESVTRIKEGLNDQLADMKGQFGGMEKTIDQFIGKLDSLIAKQRQLSNAPAISFMPEPAPTGGGAPVIDFQPMPTSTPRPTTAPTPAPVINVNVKTDTTQSNAMVGKAIVKEVNKYTGGGGGLRGVKVVAL